MGRKIFGVTAGTPAAARLHRVASNHQRCQQQ